MTASRLDARAKRVFLCLLVLLSVNSKVWAKDKDTSAALSHYIIAVMHDNLGNIDAAIREYKEALKADDKSSVIHLNLALDYLKNNEIPKAVEELKLTSEINPEAVEPHAILALIYTAQEQPALAQKEYESALQKAASREPQNIDTYKSLGLLYIQQKRFKDAEDTYRLVLQLSGKDSEAHFYLANIYDQMKNRPAAIGELKKAIELNKDYHQALNYLGYIYVEENMKSGQAYRMIKKALELDPENGAYIDSLGWYYFKRGRFKDALKKLKKAASLLEDPVIYDHLGDAYYKLKDKENAGINWDRSLKMDPEQEEVKEKIEELNKLNPK